MKHISSGDLLRDEVASGSELGQKLQETMTKGELVSMKTVLGMIAAEMIDAKLKGFQGRNKKLICILLYTLYGSFFYHSKYMFVMKSTI